MNGAKNLLCATPLLVGNHPSIQIKDWLDIATIDREHKIAVIFLLKIWGTGSSGCTSTLCFDNWVWNILDSEMCNFRNSYTAGIDEWIRDTFPRAPCVIFKLYLNDNLAKTNHFSTAGFIENLHAFLNFALYCMHVVIVQEYCDYYLCNNTAWSWWEINQLQG